MKYILFSILMLALSGCCTNYSELDSSSDAEFPEVEHWWK